MSPAYSIVTERPIDGYDQFVNGQAVAQANDQLDRLAAEAGVRPLIDYFSMDPEEVDTLFNGLNLEPATEGSDTEPGDDSAPDDGAPLLDETPSEEWFTAEEGLTTVRALIEAVAKQPTLAVDDPFEPTPEAIIANLREFEAVLDHLAAADIRWHLSVNF